MHETKRSWFNPALLIACVILSSSLAAHAANEIVATGKFEGRSDHVVSGGVSVLRTDSGYVVLLEPDFRLDGAPDPKLGFGKSGYKPSTQFSHLRSNDGAQAYAVPASINPEDYDEIWVWCQKFDLPLGVAHLLLPEHPEKESTSKQ